MPARSVVRIVKLEFWTTWRTESVIALRDSVTGSVSSARANLASEKIQFTFYVQDSRSPVPSFHCVGGSEVSSSAIPPFRLERDDVTIPG